MYRVGVLCYLYRVFENIYQILYNHNLMGLPKVAAIVWLPWKNADPVCIREKGKKKKKRWPLPSP
jgi:hypothetical protein